MNAQEIFELLKEIKSKIRIYPHEGFEPSAYHIWLSFNRKKGGEAVPYFDYDPKAQEILGNHKDFLPKLRHFLRETKNQEFISEIERNL